MKIVSQRMDRDLLKTSILGEFKENFFIITFDNLRTRLETISGAFLKMSVQPLTFSPEFNINGGYLSLGIILDENIKRISKA